MTAVLKVDSLDLSVHLRVNQGDGLDPHHGGDFLEPQFSDAAVGEGDPLLSIHEGNREQAFPVILNPAKAGYADTKDGLHQLVRDINRALAGAQQIQWQDDGASSPTFYDVTFARFEPAYDYRRAQKHWLPGVVHVWARPFGHTGTARVVATALASGLTEAPIGSVIDGDVPALAVITVGAIPVASNASLALGPTQVLAGVAVAPASLPILTPAPSIVVNSPATLMGASGAIASQARRWLVPSGGAGISVVASVSIPSVPPGRYRLLMLARHGTLGGVGTSPTVAFYAFDSRKLTTQGPGLGALGPTQMLPSKSATPGSWLPLDVGVITQASPAFDTQPLSFCVQSLTNSSGASQVVDLAGVLVLPEDSSALFVDTNYPFAPGRMAVATYLLDDVNGPVQRWGGSLTSLLSKDDISDVQRGQLPQIPVGTGMKVAAFALGLEGGAHNVPASVEIKVRERFQFSR